MNKEATWTDFYRFKDDVKVIPTVELMEETILDLERQLAEVREEVERLRKVYIKATHELDITWCAIPIEGSTTISEIRASYKKLIKEQV